MSRAHKGKKRQPPLAASFFYCSLSLPSVNWSSYLYGEHYTSCSMPDITRFFISAALTFIDIADAR